MTRITRLLWVYVDWLGSSASSLSGRWSWSHRRHEESERWNPEPAGMSLTGEGDTQGDMGLVRVLWWILCQDQVCP